MLLEIKPQNPAHVAVYREITQTFVPFMESMFDNLDRTTKLQDSKMSELFAGFDVDGWATNHAAVEGANKLGHGIPDLVPAAQDAIDGVAALVRATLKDTKTPLTNDAGLAFNQAWSEQAAPFRLLNERIIETARW